MGLIKKKSIRNNNNAGLLTRQDSRELVLLREFYQRQMALQNQNVAKKLDIGFLHASPLIYKKG